MVPLPRNNTSSVWQLVGLFWRVILAETRWPNPLRNLRRIGTLNVALARRLNATRGRAAPSRSGAGFSDLATYPEAKRTVTRAILNSTSGTLPRTRIEAATIQVLAAGFSRRAAVQSQLQCSPITERAAVRALRTTMGAQACPEALVEAKFASLGLRLALELAFDPAGRPIAIAVPQAVIHAAT